MATISIPNPFQRNDAFPLDATVVFSTYAQLTAYASNASISQYPGIMYPGQICAVSGAPTTAYIINSDFSLSAIALKSNIYSVTGSFVPNSVINTLTGNWNSSYTNLTANSANWQSTYTTVSTNSANWNTAYQNVSSSNLYLNSSTTSLSSLNAILYLNTLSATSIVTSYNLAAQNQIQYLSSGAVKVYQFYNTATNSLDTVFN